MAATNIPDREPKRLTAGDTATWTYDSANDPIASGGTLSYSIAGVAVLVWSAAWISSVVGTVSTVKIPAASTVSLPGGIYQFTRHLTLASDRYSTVIEPLAIEANPAIADAGDAQLWQEKVLAQLEATLLSQSADQMQTYLVAGRQVVLRTLVETLTLRDRMRREINQIRWGGRFREHAVIFTPPGADELLPFIPRTVTWPW